MKVPFLLGRLIYGGYFLYAGINHFRNPRKLAAYTVSRHVPFPGMAVTVSGAMLTLGGLSVLLGLKPKYGILAIAGFLAAVSPVMHRFWGSLSAEEREGAMVHFAKNMALLGAGLGMLGTEEPWPVSVPVEAPAKLVGQARDTARRLAA